MVGIYRGLSIISLLSCGQYFFGGGPSPKSCRRSRSCVVLLFAPFNTHSDSFMQGLASEVHFNSEKSTVTVVSRVMLMEL